MRFLRVNSLSSIMKPACSTISGVVRMGVPVRMAMATASDVRASMATVRSPSEKVSSDENMPSSKRYMYTSLSFTPKAWAKLTKRSCVMGLGVRMPSRQMAIDCASAAPITTGMRRGPLSSASTRA